MRVVVILLTVGLLIVGLLYFNEVQNAKTAHEQLLITSNQVVAAKLELTSIRTQMIERVTELESTTTTEKAKADEHIAQLQERVKVVEQDLRDEKNKLASVEDHRTKVVTLLGTVSNQLVTVRHQLADLTVTHTATEMELDALHDREDALEMEKTSLERQLSDLDALKSQIRLVKRRLWEEHIAEWKRQDQEAAAHGNKGVIFQRGQWQATGKPPS